MKKNQNILSYLSVLIFVLWIGIGCILLFVLPKKEYSESEKRYLATMPELSAKHMLSKEFGSELSSFVSDHVPFRSFFVGVNAYHELLAGRNTLQDYYYAKEGYLVQCPPKYSENTPITNLSRFDAFAEQTGLESKILIIPSAGAQLDHLLPQNHMPYADEKIFSLASELNTLKLIDIRSDFSEAISDWEQVYYRTDHHITAYGSYLAYRNVCESFGLDDIREIDDFTKESFEGFYGTTYSGSGYFLQNSDNVELWYEPEDAFRVSVFDTAEPQTQDSVFYRNRLQEQDMYTVYMDGNHSRTKTINQNMEQGHLLIIGDSYTHCLTTLLARNYASIDCIDLRYYRKSVSELIESEEITEILYVYGMQNILTDTNSAWLE